ncbi:MAG TPA: hypothetical protein VKZ18_13250, partial [Polyangia bacterium]|nr:hypothetical protein [Polyangia bacterium]
MKSPALTGLALLAGLLGPGCAKETAPRVAGDIQLALVLPDGATLTTVTYEVTNSAGHAIAGPATLVVSDPHATLTLDIVVPATPPGDPGDSVFLTATTSAGTPCHALSAPFPVAA